MIEKFLFLLFVCFAGGTKTQDFGIFTAEVKLEDKCVEDVGRIINGIKHNKNWALKIIDASTKFPSGILSGHLFDLGNYDECLKDNQNVETQFCIANIYPSGSNLTESGLRWSYCLPASCSPTTLENILKYFVSNLGMTVMVNPKECQTKEGHQITAADYFGICTWGVFLGLVILSTIYDVWSRRNTFTDDRKHQVLISFSAYTNGKKLLNTDKNPETMAPLHGLRFLSICWVVLGHRIFFTLSPSLLNLTDLIDELNQIKFQIFIQGVLAVDTFFVLSGLLNCYMLLKVLDKSKSFPFFKYYLHRYIRLTPVLAAIVLMYATWYTLIGYGPDWFHTTSQWKQLCVDNWWSTLLYINNYYNPTTQCAGQSWYLAVDMQLYWLSPLIILPLWKCPKYGKWVLCLTLLASTLSSFVIAYIHEFRTSFGFEIGGMQDLQRTMKLIYVPTHTRASPYIIGIMIGQYLHFLKKTKTRLVISKPLILLGWLISTVISLTIIFGNYQFTRPIEKHPYNRWESSIYIALHRLGWSFVIGWIIIACLNKFGGIINSILSWKAFIPLSRLSYCIFLSHMALQQYQIGSARISEYFQYFNQIHRFFGDICFSVIAAAALTLTFESPILSLEKLILEKKENKKNLKAEINKGYDVEEPSAANS